MARGRKLVGSAQARIGRALLQHGSILVDGDQRALTELFSPEPAEGTAVTLRELLGHVSIDEVAEAVAMSLRLGLGGTWTLGKYTPDELEAADRLERDRYAKESWTWRR